MNIIQRISLIFSMIIIVNLSFAISKTNRHLASGNQFPWVVSLLAMDADNNHSNQYRTMQIDNSSGKASFAGLACSADINKSGNNYSGNFFHSCGGSIIANDLILTAAHCVTDGEYPRSNKLEFFDFAMCKKVVLGNQWLSNTDTYSVKEIYVHPQYASGKPGAINNDYDFAILKLTTPIKNATLINLAAANTSDDVPWESAYVAGWGIDVPLTSIPASEKNNGTITFESKLYYTLNSVIPTDVCLQDYAAYKPKEFNFKNQDITKNMICAGTSTEGAADYGDSGGPLFYLENPDTPYQIGLVSWSYALGDAAIPLVYANTTVLCNDDWFKKYAPGVTCKSP